MTLRGTADYAPIVDGQLDRERLAEDDVFGRDSEVPQRPSRGWELADPPSYEEFLRIGALIGRHTLDL